VNQEDSEQNEVDKMKKGADSTGQVMHICMHAVHQEPVYYKPFPPHGVGEWEGRGI